MTTEEEAGPSGATEGVGLDAFSLRKLVRWCVPMVLFTLVCVALVAQHRQAGVHREWVEDGAYFDVVAGQHLSTGAGYTVSFPEKMPYTDSVLWQWVLSLANEVFQEPLVAAYIINFFCGLGIVLVCLSLARSMLGTQSYIIAAACAVAISPGLVFAATSGGPLGLAMLLTMLAVNRHVKGMVGEASILPASSALFVGLAMLIRVEFGLLWLLFSLHALVGAGLKWRSDFRFGFAMVQSLAGTVICAVACWPLIHLNLKLIRVPWPVAVGAGGMIGGEGEATVSAVSLIPANVLASYKWLLDGSPLFGLVELLLLAAGILLLIYAGLRDREVRVHGLAIFIVVLLPALLGAMGVFTGTAGRDLIFHSLLPLFLLTGLLGFFRLPQLLGAAKPVALGAVVLIVLGLGARAYAFTQVDVRDRQGLRSARMQLEGLIADVTRDAEGGVFTDRPGYFSYASHRPVVDLSGRATVAVLQCVDAGGRLDPQKMLGLMEDRQPEWIVVWDESQRIVLSWVEYQVGRAAVQLHSIDPPEGLEGPAILQIDWSRAEQQ